MINKLAVTADYIRQKYHNGLDFRYDVLSRKIQIRQSPEDWDGVADALLFRDLTDKDICTIACECAQATDANILDREVRCVLGSDLVPSVHPLREWILSLPPYQPQSGDWIGLLASQVVVEQSPNSALPHQGEARLNVSSQSLWQNCFRKWFVAMVAGWMYDDVVNHEVLVLIGPQGIYKTTWLEHLLPPCLRDYVTKQASVRELSKDDRIRVAEFGLINMDEIDSCSARELNILKSLITTSDVNERAAYGHTKERRLRVASFCASGNNRSFLQDDTGNRRWMPFAVKSIQNPFHTTLPYQLIYAQARWLVEQGFAYWLDMEDIQTLELHNQAFMETKNEEDLLPVYFEPAEPTAPKAVFMTASEIHAKLKVWGSIEHPMPLNKFGELLVRSGYLPRKLHGGKRGYVVKVIENLSVKQHEDIHEILTGVGGVCTY